MSSQLFELTPWNPLLLAGATLLLGLAALVAAVNRDVVAYVAAVRRRYERHLREDVFDRTSLSGGQ